ncbi:MAG: right-handed parallel beta-helix repeat-containing protein [Xanthomonadales bacterium]|nr:right-handed parallel beta-helix repeat-containing protein [Xanthomonadales bacterium]
MPIDDKHRRTVRTIALAALLSIAVPALAETFTVDSLGDFADDDTGDGLCSSFRGNSGLPPLPVFRCSLRAALEQANATPGADLIEFSVAGQITLSASLGTLPLISQPVTIDGSTAPGAPGREDATSLPPVLALSGENLVAGGTFQRGLDFFTGSGGSQIINLAIINFPDSAILADESLFITGTWLGVDPASGSAGPNGTGVRLRSDGNTIGRSVAGLGRGNVISGNTGSAIVGDSSNNQISGNRIGVNAAGDVVVANGGGIVISGDGNNIGDATGVDTQRNVIAGNADANLDLSGDLNLVRGNFIGCGIGASLSSPGDGIRASGDDLTIGGSGDAGNAICDHRGDGVTVDGSGVTSAVGLAIVNNDIRGNQDGIYLDTADMPQVTDNQVYDNLFALRLRDVTNGTIARNEFGSSTASIGVRLTGSSSNTLASNAIADNQLGLLLSSGSNNNLIQDNDFGVEGVGNRGDALRFFGSNDNQVLNNSFADNGGFAVSLISEAVPGRETTGNRITENTMARNAGGIDLGGDGLTANDINDADDGPNRLQNAPDLAVDAFVQGTVNQLEVSFLVDSSDLNSVYDLTVEFFLTIADSPDQGRAFLASVAYTSPQAVQQVSLDLPPGATTGLLTATATDALGNTSEFSTPVGFGLPERVFADGFE